MTFLQTLPVVAGFRLCDGTESNVFACAACPQCDQCSEGGMDYSSNERNCAGDLDCRRGCLGQDGIQGTLDDSIDVSCPHAIDQGAVCHNDDQPTQMALPGCRRTLSASNDFRQPISFGCIEYYTTEW